MIMIQAKQYTLKHGTNHSPLISNLQTLMHHHNLNEAKLARITNIPQPTLHKILAGKTADPRISTLKILADYFNISVDKLYAGIGRPGNTQVQPITQSIPIISWDECTKGASFYNNLTLSNWKNWLIIDLPREHCYALNTKPSMEPTFPIETTLVIDPQKKPKDGSLAVVYYPDSQEATLRKLIVDGPNQMLAPINPTLPTDELTHDIKILGVVVQSKYTYT